MLKRDFKKIHMIGIGGMGMSALATILLRRNFKVTGSDIEKTEVIKRLIKKGARINIGHAASSVKDPDLVVCSSCIRKDNPEILRARNKHIPVVKRGLLLKSIVEESDGSIVVAGTHGKTTTTAVISFLLQKCGLDPTYLIGGIVGSFKDNAGYGRSGILITESDESDGSFLHLKPDHGVITNIENDHLDYYGSMGALIKAFKKFASNVKSTLFYNAEDRNASMVSSGSKDRAFSFGFKRNAGIYAKGIRFNGMKSLFNVVYKGKDLGTFCLNIPGKYNILNALPAIAIGLGFGLDCRSIKEALRRFDGVERRFQVIGRANGIKVVEDYAHHPTAIRHVLQAASLSNPKRLIVIFQPHRYSRTYLLAEEFARSFKGADMLILTDIYSAAEAPMKGIGAGIIRDLVKETKSVREVDLIPKERIKDAVADIARKGDMVLVLGAGDIGKVSRKILHRLRAGYV